MNIKKKFNIPQSFFTIAPFLLLLVVVAGCSGINRPWRSYDQKPFDSQSWRDGDAQQRGTMFVDLTRKRIVSGKTKEEVLRLLGEPDRKSTVNGSEIWHYKIEFAGENPAQEFPVIFDKNGKAGTRAGLRDEHFDTGITFTADNRSHFPAFDSHKAVELIQKAGT